MLGDGSAARLYWLPSGAVVSMTLKSGVRPLCCKCKDPIPVERLAAIPGTSICRECLDEQGDVEKLQGVMLWEHKTAPFIAISNPQSIQEVLRQSRKSSRANLRFEKKTSQAIPWDSLSLSANFPAGASPVNIRMSRCHKDRPAVGPSGLCVQCALEWYEVRRR